MPWHEPEEAHHRPAHLSALRDPAPWSRHSAARHGEAPAAGDGRSPAGPVFVDDSGRRREVGRMIGVALGVVVLAYLVVVGLTFAGSPLGGSLAPPGVEDLSRPSRTGASSIGVSTDERPLPSEATAAEAPDPADLGAAGTPGTGSPGTATTAPTGSTGAPPPPGGDPPATTTTEPSPGSTVPTRPTHTVPDGPPDEPPGKP
jgi:hypothetical protein